MTASSRSEIEEACARADALHRAGEYEQAVLAYHAARSLGAREPELDYNLGAALRRAHRAEEAAAAYWRVVAARPEWPEAYNNLGLALADLGRWPEAEVAFECALALEPALVAALVNLGNAQRELARGDEAARTFERALEIDPASPEAHYNAFPLALDRDGPDAALVHLDRAIQARPDHVLARHYRAAICALFSISRPAEHASRGAGSATEPSRPEPGAPIPTFLAASLAHVLGVRAARTSFFGDRFALLSHALAAAPPSGLVVELGVWRGVSLAFLAREVGGPVHGFDSLVGLPEAWGELPSGSYSSGGVAPPLPPLAELHAGWFADTLPRFLDERAGAVRFVHVDCDLYGATREALELLAPRLAPRAIIVCDDYLDYPGWEDGEHRALFEVAERHRLVLEPIAFGLSTRQAAFAVAPR